MRLVRLRDRRRLKLQSVSAHVPTETAEDLNKDTFYDDLNTLIRYKIPSLQAIIVGIDTNAKAGLHQQSECMGNGSTPWSIHRTSDGPLRADKSHHCIHI
ncbi:hypothetical protein RB195_007429 [Necator americanus]|uniref:Copine C-terminal domain-containing protein n=1 Tax=Necator americanus TaxID=51031 RepID=A0ABR1C0R6_NECAM